MEHTNKQRVNKGIHCRELSLLLYLLNQCSLEQKEAIYQYIERNIIYSQLPEMQGGVTTYT